MTTKEFEATVEQIITRCWDLLKAKGHDYSADTDRLKAFRDIANGAGITPEQVFLTLLNVKVSRLAQLLGTGKTPKNEAVDDTIDDLINYGILLRAFRMEPKPKGKPKWCPMQGRLPQNMQDEVTYAMCDLAPGHEGRCSSKGRPLMMTEVSQEYLRLA